MPASQWLQAISVNNLSIHSRPTILKRKKNSCKGIDMKILVDKDLCVGDKTCVAICPELFTMDGDVAKTKMKKVPESLVDLCWDAAESCPAEAIIIEK